MYLLYFNKQKKFRVNLPHFARDSADGEELLRLQPEAAAAAAAANTAFVRNFPRSVTCARPHDRCGASELAERICATHSLGSGA